MDKWDLYDMEHVTFILSSMSLRKLRKGFEWFNSSFLLWGSVFPMLFKMNRSLQVIGPMRFSFNKVWKKS
jgi:hypothetical protein